MLESFIDDNIKFDFENEQLLQVSERLQIDINNELVHDFLIANFPEDYDNLPYYSTYFTSQEDEEEECMQIDSAQREEIVPELPHSFFNGEPVP